MVNTIKFSQLNAGQTPGANDIFAMTQTVSSALVSVGITPAQLALYLNTLFLPLTGGTLSGNLFIPDVTFEAGSPTPTQVIPYTGVQTVASANGGAKQFVIAASTINLDATYAPGTDPDNAAKGATLTANNNEELILDGIPIDSFLGERVAIGNQSTGTENGLYQIVQFGQSGTSGVPWILRRCTDFDNSSTGQVLNGCLIYVLEGDTLEKSLLVATTVTFEDQPIIDIGVDAVGFFIINGNSPAPSNSGVVTLVAGTATVDFPAIDSSSIVIPGYQTIVGSPGFISSVINSGVGFTLNSTATTADNSVVGWIVAKGGSVPVTKGSVSLVAGVATVSTSAVTASCRIILSIREPINSSGKIYITSQTNGVDFSISSDYGLDTSLINWALYDTGSIEENGQVVLSGGSASVPLATLGATDIVLVTIKSASGSLGDISVTNKVSTTGFDIVSNSALDASTVNWVVYPDASSVPHGLVSLVASTVTASTPAVGSSSIILMSSQNPSLTFGNFAVGTVVNGVSTQFNSNYGADTSQLGYVILN